MAEPFGRNQRASDTVPHTRNELHVWIRSTLRLTESTETALLSAIDAVFTRHERLWQESKQDAIQALSAGFADKMARLKNELSTRDATVSSVSGRGPRISTPGSAATNSAS